MASSNPWFRFSDNPPQERLIVFRDPNVRSSRVDVQCLKLLLKLGQFRLDLPSPLQMQS